MPRYYFSSVNLIVYYLVLPKVFFMAIGIDSIEVSSPKPAQDRFACPKCNDSYAHLYPT